MTGSNVIRLQDRLLRPLRMRVPYEPPPTPPGIEVVHYLPAAIHEGVPVTVLVAALNRAGLTFSNVEGRGLVIHRVGQHPERPDSGPLDAS